MKSLIILAVCLAAASAGMISEKMMKKYTLGKAMMGCFGEKVMGQYHQEYTAAMEKCRGGHHQAAEPLVEVDETETFVENLEEQPLEGHYRRRRSYHNIDADQMERMRHELKHRLNNFSCLMKEMDLVDETGAITADKVKAHILSLNIESQHLVNDLVEGAERCAQYSGCVPESLFDKAPVDIITGRNMKMMKCFKYAKVESCMRQDFRTMHQEKLTAAQLNEDEAFNLIAVSGMVKEMTRDM